LNNFLLFRHKKIASEGNDKELFEQLQKAEPASSGMLSKRKSRSLV
jgi:hypothetical protein